jgi:hypothetical protein
MARGLVDLEWLLNYELRGSVRYRRFVSIVVVACGDLRASPTELLANNLVRESDEPFEIEAGYAIVMGETDRIGALTAVERFKRRCNGQTDLRFAVVSFPVDGYIAGELLTTAHRRLSRARALYPGAVVATG